ncbi:MAG: symbB [Pedosphaera sp.]|nr:symbB [Pedosphaera sp.]
MTRKVKKSKFPNDHRLFRHAAASQRETAEAMLREWPELLEAKGEIGETALPYNAIENNVEAVVWLLSKKAAVDTRDTMGRTPLMHVAGLGYLELCKILIEAGADASAIDSELETALHQAAKGGYVDICKLLLEAGTPVNAQSDIGETAWDLALPRKREAVRDVLKAAGGGPGSSPFDA